MKSTAVQALLEEARALSGDFDNLSEVVAARTGLNQTDLLAMDLISRNAPVTAASGLARMMHSPMGDTLELERGAPFCSNPDCALHVRLLDTQSEGGGSWVTLPDGRTFGRCRSGNWLFCDACATRRGPVKIVPAAIGG